MLVKQSGTNLHALCQRPLTLHLLPVAINLYGYAAGGETCCWRGDISSFFRLQKTRPF